MAHILRASIGTRGSSTNVGGLRKVNTNVVVNLANVRVPKYAARILFLKVIAYNLGRGYIGWIGRTNDTPQQDEYVRSKRENRERDRLDVERNATPKRRNDVSTKPSFLTRENTG